jgi:tight adherence protein C
MANLNALLAPALTAIACGSLLILPIILRKSSPSSDTRGDAWRDQLPLLLRLVHPLVKAYAYSIDSGLAQQRRDLLQDRINAAGAGYLVTPAEFLVIRRLACVIALAIALYCIFLLGLTNPLTLAIAGSLVSGSYFYPDLWLRDTTRRRHLRFQKEFPFFLDVLVLTMKAGLTFGVAVEQAVEQSREGPVKQEFLRYLRETRTGVQRRVALDRLGQRVMLPAVSNFVASVAQADETGGSLGEILADQARLRRQERFLRAEKLANRAPVKMLFPLLFLLFPITFLILFFPIALQVFESGIFN